MWQNAGFWWCCAEMKQTGKLPRWAFKVHLFWGCLGGSDKWQKCDVADPSFQPFLPPPPLPALSPPRKRPNQFAQSYAFDTNAPLHLFHWDEKLLWKVLQGIRRSLTVRIGKPTGAALSALRQSPKSTRDKLTNLDHRSLHNEEIQCIPKSLIQMEQYRVIIGESRNIKGRTKREKTIKHNAWGKQEVWTSPLTNIDISNRIKSIAPQTDCYGAWYIYIA